MSSDGGGLRMTDSELAERIRTGQGMNLVLAETYRARRAEEAQAAAFMEMSAEVERLRAEVQRLEHRLVVASPERMPAAFTAARERAAQAEKLNRLLLDELTRLKMKLEEAERNGGGVA